MADQEFQTLLVEAQELGLHYTGDDVVELEGLVTMARAEKGKDHPVPCFGLSYDPTDRRCRICSLRNPCADQDKKPRVELANARLQMLPCEVCGKGHLEIELLDPETRELRDYGCTTKGCPGTVSIQCGWETHAQEVAREVAFETQDSGAAEAKPVGGDDSPSSEPAQAGGAASGTPEPDKPRVRLRVVQGGGAKSAPAKKAAKKKATKKGAKKAAARKGASAKKGAKPAKPAGKKLVFMYDGKPFDSLTKVVNTITASRNWSPQKFFGVKPGTAKAGDTYEKQWKGSTHIVEVIGK